MNDLIEMISATQDEPTSDLASNQGAIIGHSR